jgi:hypothetical protein
VARSKVAKNDNLIDPKLKKTFIEMRDHWQSLNDRANSAAAKRRQYQKEIKESGYSMTQIKISLSLQTPEGEAEFKAEMANRLLAAAYSDADIGEQLSLFLDGDRTPAADRAYKEGQTCAMKNEAAVPKYAPDTDQYQAFMQGYHDEQGRQVKAGIGKLEGAPKGAKKAAKAAPAKATGKRGRPKGSGKKAAPEASETRLITKAEKEATAAARVPKTTDAPPRRPAAAPVTRATLAAQKEAAREEADSYFSKTKPAGNA